jgi:hypothetical protein
MHDSDRLHVFISSRMRELVDLRAVLKKELDRIGLNAFVYEADTGAKPDDPETVSLLEVERTDIFVLVIGDTHGAITEREYDRARELGKPCLIYERLGRIPGDDRLEAFVKKFSGAKGVPSRSTFGNAVDLAEKVAKDVHGWLTSDYRRLSAEHAKPELPTRRALEIEQQLKTIDTAILSSVPKGNASDYLSWQLRQWFEALEFPIISEPKVYDEHIDFQIKVPDRRKYTIALIRAKSGELQTADVRLGARDIAAGTIIDEIWIVAERRVSSAAREAARELKNVYVYTLDEVIDQDVKFDAYFANVEKEAHATGIAAKYVPLKIIVEEIGHGGTVDAQSRYDNISDYAERWLVDKDAEHLSLLGEFGTGKSWYSLYLAFNEIRNYKRAQERGLPRPRIPLLVRLRDYARGFKDVGGLLTDFVFREQGIAIPNYKVLDLLNRMGRLLYIFDGFDEMAERVNQQKMVDNFWALADVLGPGSKAILTCRTEYFRFAQQARDVFRGKLKGATRSERHEQVRFQIATIQMFDGAQLRAVFANRGADPTIIERLLADAHFSDLIRRPVMIDLMIDAISQLSGEEQDTAEIYFKAAIHKMDRDIKSGRTLTSRRDKFFFMCEVSDHMLRTSKMSVHFKEISELLRNYFGEKLSDAESDHWQHDLLSQTMLVRDDDGDYKPAHKSFLEFFCALKLAGLLGVLKQSYFDTIVLPADHPGSSDKEADRSWREVFSSSGNEFGRVTLVADRDATTIRNHWLGLPFDDALRNFTADVSDGPKLAAAVRGYGIGIDVDPEFAGRLCEIATCLRISGGLDFRDVQLSKMRLHNRKVTGINLASTTITDSEIVSGTFRNCCFDGAIFRRVRCCATDFEGSTFKHAEFDHFDYLLDPRCALWCTQGRDELVMVGFEGGLLFLVDPVCGRTTRVESRWIDEIEKVGPSSSGGGTVELETGPVALSRNGWWKSRATLEASVLPPLTCNYDTEHFAGGDVEKITIKLSDAGGSVVFETTFADASALGSHGTRAVCFNETGTQLCTVGVYEKHITGYVNKTKLACFDGEEFEVPPETIDSRLGCFSPSGKLILLRERSSTYGIWNSATGDRVWTFDLVSMLDMNLRATPAK